MPERLGPLFIAVAEKARERQIRRVGRSAMLLGDDVVDLERQIAVGLRKPAVFAAIPGALPDQADKSSLHRS